MNVKLFFALCYFLSLGSSSQTWSWAQGSNSGSAGLNASLATDASGNVVITGAFNGSLIAFANHSLNAISGSNLYVVKYDAAGNVLWARTQTGGSALGISVAIDLTGNIFVSGQFNNTIVLGTYTLSSIGSSDIFTVKYDAAGNILWARSGGGTGGDQALNSCVDASGNLLLTGSSSSSLSSYSTLTLSGAGSSDSFLLKYDANGNVLWGFNAGCSGSDAGTGVSCDAMKNVYLTGGFAGSAVQFGTVIVNPVLNTSGLYIVRFDSAGIALWGTTITGSAIRYPRGISAEPGGDFYLTGYYTGSMVIGQQNFTVATSSNGFVAKYDTGGNPLWAKVVNGPVADYFTSASVFQGGVFVAGYTNSLYFYLDTLLYSGLTGNDGTMFIVKYDSNGDQKNIVFLNGTGGDEATVAALNQCTVYTTGDYQVPSFTVGATTFTKTGNGHPTFTAKLVFPPPSNISGGNFQVCLGQSITLTGSGANTYTWSTGSISPSISVSPQVNTSYTMHSTGGCGNTSIVKTITVNPLPIISAVSDEDTVCSGDLVKLTASGASTYTWTNGVQNGVSFSPSVSSTYFATGSSSAGCLSSNTPSLYVYVINSPTVTPTASSTLICSGKSTTLFATGAVSYSWEPGGLTQGTVVVSPTLNTVYTVTKTNAICVITDFIYIEVMPSPVLFTTISAATICPGDSVVLAASGADEYLWNTADSSNVITVKPAITSGYTVTGISLLNSCSTSHVFYVEVVDCTVGVAENTGHRNFRIFPNPARSILTIELPDEYLISDLTIYDSPGKKIAEIKCSETHLDLDLSQIRSGVYLIALTRGGETVGHFRLLIE